MRPKRYQSITFNTQIQEKTTTSLADIRKIYHFYPGIIGKGSYGTIRKAYDIKNPHHIVAVKTIPKKFIRDHFKDLIKELKILK